MAADASQLALEQQINAAIQARSALMEQNKAGLADQIALALDLCKALECRELEGVEERLGAFQKGLLEASEASEELGTSTQKVDKAMKKAQKSSLGWKAAGVAAFVGIKNAASGAFKVISGIPGLITGGVMGAFNIFKMGVGAFNSMIDGMLGKAIEMRNGSNGLRDAMEEVREEFGALHKGEGRAVIDTWKNVGTTMKGTGTSLSKYFGSGPDGSAAKLKMFNEVASGMGPVFSRLAGDFAKAGQEIIIAQNALGMTGEGMAALTLTGRAHGKTMKQVLQDVQKQVVQVSKAYGVNEKITGKMLDKMAQAPEIFGTDTKEMLKMSVAAQKLGVSIETLGKTTQVFDDFESGAKAASELAAQFGITVDAMDMMSATPAEQVTMLKDALQESGQSFDDMSRQEKARLADLTKMDMGELQNLMDPTSAFDMDAMDDVDAGVDKATQATMNQTEATKALEKAMKKVNETGQSMSAKGGFLGTFIDGMMTGLANSKEFRQILNWIYDSFKIVHRAGVKVGRILAELFGKDGPLHVFTEFFENMFNPKKMQKRMDNIVGFFRTFVDSAKKGGEEGTSAFTTLFTSVVGEFFGSEGPGGFIDLMLQGLEDAFDWIGASLVKFLPTILKGLTSLFKFAISALNGELSTPEFGGSLAKDGLFPLITSALNDPALVTAWDGLVETFLEFVNKMWDEYGTEISWVLGGIIAAIVGAALLQSLPMILGSAIVGTFVGGLTDKIKGMVGIAAKDAGASVPPKDLGTKIMDFAAGIKLAVEELASINFMKLGKAAIILGLIVGVGAVGIWYGIKGIIMAAKEVMASGVSPIILAGTTLAILGMVKVVEGLGWMINSLSYANITASKMKKILPVLVAIVLVVAAVGAIMVTVVKELAKIKTPPAEASIMAYSTITMTTLEAVAGIALIALGLTILTLLPGVGQALVLAVLAAATAVFAAVAGVILGIVYAFSRVPRQKAKTAMIAAEAGSKIVETMMIVLAAMASKVLKVTLGNPKKVLKALDSMKSIIDAIACKFMPAMQEAANAITEDPDKVKKKLEVFTQVINAIAPLADMYAAAMEMAKGPAGRGTNMTEVIKALTAGVTGILEALSGFVNTMITSLGAMDDKDLDKASKAAPLIDAIAGLMGGLVGPMSGMKQQFVVLEGATDENFMDDPDKGAQQAVRIGNNRKDMMTMMKAVNCLIADIGPSLKTVMNELLSVNFGDDTAEEAGEKIAVMVKVIDAIGGLGAVFGQKAMNPGTIKHLATRFEAMVDAIITKSGESQVLQKAQRAAEAFGAFGASSGVSAENIKKGASQFKDVVTGTLEAIMMVSGEGTLNEKLQSWDIGVIRYFFTRIGNLFGVMADNKASFTAKGAPAGALLAEFQNVGKELSWGAMANIRQIGNLGEVLTLMSDLQPDADAFVETMNMTVWGSVAKMINEFNEIGVELGSAQNIVDIEDTLKNIGQALKIDGKTVTVDRGDVQITVNLKVGLQASTLSEVLVYNGLVWKGPKYNNVLGSGHGSGETFGPQ